MMPGHFQIKIQVYDIAHRVDGQLFLRGIDEKNLWNLWAALDKLGMKKVQLDPKVDGRQGGTLLWSGKVITDLDLSLDDADWQSAQVFAYPATDDEESIGVLTLEDMRQKSVTYINLNGVMFSRGSEEDSEVTLRNFNVVQTVTDGVVSDTKLDPLAMRVVGYSFPAKAKRKLVLLQIGKSGINALYEALSKAGADEIAY